MRIRLLYHSLDKWATVTKNRLLALGCSEEYAEACAQRIREAELVRLGKP